MAEYKNVIDLIQKSDLDRNIKKDILTELNNRKSAEFLSLVRNYENLSEEEIAKRMGVSVDYIFKLETSTDDKITIQDLINYAKALKANFSIQFSKKVNLVEQFIYHKNQIEKISKEMVKLVQNDPTLDNHISQFFHKQIDKMFEMFSKVTKELEHIKIQKVTPPKETLQYDYSIEKEETTEKS